MLDASVTLSWIFEGERDGYAVASARHVGAHGALVPALWRWEIQNTLLSALRRHRIDEDGVARHLADLAALPIYFDLPSMFGAELVLALQYDLTAYDAAYLELAMRHTYKLATKDEKLARAARTAGVYFEHSLD